MRVLVSSEAQGGFHRTKFRVFTGEAYTSQDAPFQAPTAAQEPRWPADPSSRYLSGGRRVLGDTAHAHRYSSPGMAARPPSSL